MTRATVERAGRAAQLLGGLLGATLSLRVMSLAIGEAQARRAPVPDPSPPVPQATAISAPARGGPPRARSGPTAEHGAAPGHPLRLMLSVAAGPERSEVYVNGSRLGLSPYLGDLSCKQGEQLRIEVVPVREALITRFATCEGRTLLIR